MNSVLKMDSDEEELWAIQLKDSKNDDINSIDDETPGPSAEPLSNLSLNTHKAGMQGLDAAKVNEIIRKASEGSRYYQHKQQAQHRLDAKIKDMLRTAAGLSSEILEKATKRMVTLAQQYEQDRDLSRTIVHVDMDMFFAAVEMRDQPHLSSVPMAVGGASMLSTSNYIARQFGVRAGMPGFIARQLCPKLVLVPPNFSKYKAVSRVVQEVFALYDPNYAMMSLDEAYLDITDYMEANADSYVAKSEEDNETLAEAVVREMRLKIEEATELTASAGIAANTRLAKVCSDLNKPDGQYYLPSDPGAIMDFITKLPIRKISGIGNVTEQQLKALGITLCGELRPNYGRLRLLFSDSSWHYFVRISLGLGETDLGNYTGGDQKSISTETTFQGTSCRQKLLQIVSDLCVELHGDMVKKGLVGKLVTLKTKTVDFVLKTRSIALGEPTSDPQVTSNVARKLLTQEIEKSSSRCPLAFRLLGVRMSNLCENIADGKEKQVTISKMFQKLTESGSCSNGNKDLNEKESGVHETQSSTNELANSEGESHAVLCLNQGSPCKPGIFDISESPENTRYICPVCENVIKTKFLSTFNKHIDSCLQNKAETLEDAAESSANSVTKESEVQMALPDSNSIEKSECEDSRTTLNTNQAFIPQSSTDSSSYSIAANSKSSKHSAGLLPSSVFASRSQLSNEPQSSNYEDPVPHENEGKVSNTNEIDCRLLCPVCNYARFSSNESLNNHLDICLNNFSNAVSEETAPNSETFNGSDSKSIKPSTDEMSVSGNRAGNSFFARLQQLNTAVLNVNSGEIKPHFSSSPGYVSSENFPSDMPVRLSAVPMTSTNLKRKAISKVSNNRKRRAAKADLPITSFFSK